MIYSPLFVTFCTTASVFFSGTVYVGLQYDESLVDYREPVIAYEKSQEEDQLHHGSRTGNHERGKLRLQDNICQWSQLEDFFKVVSTPVQSSNKTFTLTLAAAPFPLVLSKSPHILNVSLLSGFTVDISIDHRRNFSPSYTGKIYSSIHQSTCLQIQNATCSWKTELEECLLRFVSIKQCPGELESRGLHQNSKSLDSNARTAEQKTFCKINHFFAWRVLYGSMGIALVVLLVLLHYGSTRYGKMRRDLRNEIALRLATESQCHLQSLEKEESLQQALNDLQLARKHRDTRIKQVYRYHVENLKSTAEVAQLSEKLNLYEGENRQLKRELDQLRHLKCLNEMKELEAKEKQVEKLRKAKYKTEQAKEDLEEELRVYMFKSTQEVAKLKKENQTLLDKNEKLLLKQEQLNRGLEVAYKEIEIFKKRLTSMAATYCSQFNELAAASDIDLSTSSAEVSPEACKDLYSKCCEVVKTVKEKMGTITSPIMLAQSTLAPALSLEGASYQALASTSSDSNNNWNVNEPEETSEKVTPVGSPRAHIHKADLGFTTNKLANVGILHDQWRKNELKHKEMTRHMHMYNLGVTTSRNFLLRSTDDDGKKKIL